jgi:hypothetical protein
MDMENKRDETDAIHVQEATSGGEEHHREHYRHHHETMRIIPIEEEAVTDAVHIDLSWRSWVRSTSPNNQLTSPEGGIC